MSRIIDCCIERRTRLDIPLIHPYLYERKRPFAAACIGRLLQIVYFFVYVRIKTKFFLPVPDALAWHGWTYGAFITPGSVNPDFVKAEAAAASKPSDKLHVHKPFGYGVPSSKVFRGQGRATGPNGRDDRTGLSSCPDKNSRSSATIFERWLNSCSGKYSGNRVETIPPEDLDGLLADFLAVVKKTSGGDYDAVSFSNLRYNLDRYLSAKGYGHVISKSPLFGRSQAVFNNRRSQLKAKANKCSATLSFTSPTLVPQQDEQKSVHSGSEETAQEGS